MMPWTNNGNERAYKPSLFAKEELPTWNEIYDDYYKNIFLCNDHIYDSSSPGPIDPYWKIPRKKYILSTICNQFNKMILEDGFKDDLLKAINEVVFHSQLDKYGAAYDVRFCIRLLPYLDKEDVLTDADKKALEDLKFNTPEFISAISGTVPYIYTIGLPSGKKNPFITNNNPRIDISSLDGPLCLYPIIKSYIDGNHGKDNHKLYTVLPTGSSNEAYKDIIEFMMIPYKDYFVEPSKKEQKLEFNPPDYTGPDMKGLLGFIATE